MLIWGYKTGLLQYKCILDWKKKKKRGGLGILFEQMLEWRSVGQDLGTTGLLATARVLNPTPRRPVEPHQGQEGSRAARKPRTWGRKAVEEGPGKPFTKGLKSPRNFKEA